MMEKRAPSMMDTMSLFDYQSTFDKMAAHVKESHNNGDVSNKPQQPPVNQQPSLTPYKTHDFSFMNKGK